MVLWVFIVIDKVDKGDDNTIKSILKILKNQFAGDEVNLAAMFGRGYSVWSVVQYILNRKCSIVVATERRSPWFPFVYGMKQHPGDLRTDIPTAGPKMVWSKHLDVKMEDGGTAKLGALSCRNGSGGVILAMSSEIMVINGRLAMDFVLKNPSDSVWYNKQNPSELARKWFAPLTCEHLQSKDAGLVDRIAELTQSDVKPVTTEPNNAAWFYLRMYSLTSSTTDRFIAHICKPD